MLVSNLEKKTKTTITHLIRQCRILFEELDNTVCQLRMIHAEALDLVQRNQDPGQEKLVLFLERQSKTVDDGSQDFQQLCNSIEPLGLVGELEENVVDRPSNV